MAVFLTAVLWGTLWGLQASLPPHDTNSGELEEFLEKNPPPRSNNVLNRDASPPGSPRSDAAGSQPKSPRSDADDDADDEEKSVKIQSQPGPVAVRPEERGAQDPPRPQNGAVPARKDSIGDRDGTQGDRDGTQGDRDITKGDGTQGDNNKEIGAQVTEAEPPAPPGPESGNTKPPGPGGDAIELQADACRYLAIFAGLCIIASAWIHGWLLVHIQNFIKIGKGAIKAANAAANLKSRFRTKKNEKNNGDDQGEENFLQNAEKETKAEYETGIARTIQEINSNHMVLLVVRAVIGGDETEELKDENELFDVVRKVTGAPDGHKYGIIGDQIYFANKAVTNPLVIPDLVIDALRNIQFPILFRAAATVLGDTEVVQLLHDKYAKAKDEFKKSLEPARAAMAKIPEGEATPKAVVDNFLDHFEDRDGGSKLRKVLLAKTAEAGVSIWNKIAKSLVQLDVLHDKSQNTKIFAVPAAYVQFQIPSEKEVDDMLQVLDGLDLSMVKPDKYLTQAVLDSVTCIPTSATTGGDSASRGGMQTWVAALLGVGVLVVSAFAP